MADIEELIARILGSRKPHERASFSTRTYADQPILQSGRQLRERMEREEREQLASRERKEARSRQKAADPDRASRSKVGYGTKGDPKAERDLSRTYRPVGSAATPQGSARPGRSGTRVQMTFEFDGTGRDAGHRGRDLRTDDVPERYRQLRAMAQGQARPVAASRGGRGNLAYGSRVANRLFFEQAKFMEDFEDNYDYHGSFVQYFPTYASMTIEQLRGYVSWRTRVRRGQVEDAPLSFAFVYVYELLCGVGTTPGERGYHDLAAFRDAFGPYAAAQGGSFDQYLRIWLHDYVVYHGLDPALLPASTTGELQAQVLTLLDAEGAHLAALGRTRKLLEGTGKGASAGEAPSDERLLEAINACSSYQLCGARLYRSNPDDVRAVTCAVFRALVEHCSKRRKTDFVEGLFGAPYSVGYTMYAGAVFYEEEPHPDATFSVSPAESYLCHDGRWLRNEACEANGRSTELGQILRVVDARLRARLDYPYPLKERKAAAYVMRIIDKAIDELLARKAAEEREREEAERRRIHVDLSQLAGIRAAAALTQEALLTEDEREEVPRPVVEGPVAGGEEPRGSDVAAAEQGETRVSQAGVATEGTEPQPAVAPAATPPRPTPAPAFVSDAGATIGLSDAEARVLRALLEGRGAASALTAGDPLLSLVIDGINERMYDLVGDAVVAYEGDEPTLVEDYEPDVREIVGA